MLRMAMTGARPRSVDEYIAAAPRAAQPKLRRLRAIIKAAAPRAEERISYAMPYYHQGGRVIYFGVHRNHIGLYLVGESKYRYAKQLQKYWTEKATQVTLQLPLDEPLPEDLIGKLVRARVKEIQAAK